MNNKNLLMVFFGLACLVLLVGVFTTSTTLPNGNNGDAGLTPQQINQTLPNTNTPNSQNNTPSTTQMQNTLTEQPKDDQLPTEMNPSQMGQDMNNGIQDMGNAVKDMIPNMNAQ